MNQCQKPGCGQTGAAHDNDEAEQAVPDNDEDPIDLGEKMSRFFYFKNKLGVAIRHRNSELAAFYLEEIEEGADRIIDKNVMDEGIHVSNLMEQKLMPAIENMEKNLKSADQPAQWEAYTNLVNTCNTCHKLAKHPFVVVKPFEGEIEGQNFDPGRGID